MARRRHLFFHRLQRVLTAWLQGIGFRDRMGHCFRRPMRSLAFILLLLLGMTVPGLAAIPAQIANVPLNPASLSQASLDQIAPDQLMQQGQQRYEAGQYEAAIAMLQRAIQAYGVAGNSLQQAMAWRNLALVQQQLGQWPAATEAIAHSLALVEAIATPDRFPVLARVLDMQGSLHLAQGQTEEALATWEQASAAYDQAGDTDGQLRSRINQAQALQNLGFYRRALTVLTPLAQILPNQLDSVMKATGLRSLGDALQAVGEFDQSRTVLQQSLEIARRLQLPDATSAALLSLGNGARAQEGTTVAIALYRQAAIDAPTTLDRVRAHLNLFSLLVENRREPEARALIASLQTDLATLPPSQSGIYAQVNYAQTLITLESGVEGTGIGDRSLRVRDTAIPGSRGADAALESTDDRGSGIGSESESAITAETLLYAPVPITPLPTSQSPLPPPANIAQQLAKAVQQARSLGDPRAEAYAIGTLGRLYEQTQRWSDAQTLTEQALTLAQTSNAPDIAYRWQWQLGRILKAQATGSEAGQYEGAIAAYSSAVDTLQSLRTDLVAINPAVQLSFQKSVEPIHRELVSLLLTPGDNNPAKLEKARKVIESLQLAELDNFFREACLDAQPIDIDQIDQQAAVLYPILLSDRLEVVVRLPQQPLRHYATPVSQQQVEGVAQQLRQALTIRTRYGFLAPAQRLYDWLIRPIAADLRASNVETLVFVLDGVLRNIPMAVLHNGQQFLLEQYSLALTPGLQLLDPRPLASQNLSVLTAGLSEARQGFAALPNVLSEVELIQSEFSSRVLLNQDFTLESLQSAINASPQSVVHLATHGKFSSRLEETFILTWDGRININQLSGLLKEIDLGQIGPVELLVLSACQTATGDKQAALGLAGVAVRAGARSTLATLWQVSDEATAILMVRFYSELSKANVTKAEALRRAQLEVLQIPRFRQHPFYWAPYVIVGNWL